MEYFVSKSGTDTNDGSEESPYLTIKRGLEQLVVGDELVIRKGTYVECVTIAGLKWEGEGDAPATTIRAFTGERVVVDGSLAPTTSPDRDQFRVVGNADWQPVAGHPDEYLSAVPFDVRIEDLVEKPIAWGSFLDPERHIRLITYSDLRDLRATNQKFGQMPEVELENDPPMVVADDAEYSNLPKRPWVYLGPGVFQDPQSHKIHIRLSATNHEVRGVRNYTGQSDPRQLELAICTLPSATIRIQGCDSVVVQGMTVRGGGGVTISIAESQDTVLSRLTIWCAVDGIDIHDASKSTRMSDCVIDGGLPPWMFRSDFKTGYRPQGEAELNILGRQTADGLLKCAPNTATLLIENCEFVNGHDLQLAGTNVEFTHNWVNNINDDALFIGAGADVRIHHNALERVLTVLSLDLNSQTGHVALFRNLIDLRRPTLGRRPHPRPTAIAEVVKEANDAGISGPHILTNVNDQETAVLRQGQFFKTNKLDPPLDIFHNTILVAGATGVAAYPYFSRVFTKDGGTPRRVFNNILVAIKTEARSDKPIAYLPVPGPQGISDGNWYYRIGNYTTQLLCHQAYPGQPGSKARCFNSPADLEPSTYFDDTQTHYTPGYESSGFAGDPKFASGTPWPLNPAVPVIDDFRPKADSPVWSNGAQLPADLRDLDPPTGGPSSGSGCYRRLSQRLRVGVDGRRKFPRDPPVIAPTH